MKNAKRYSCLQCKAEFQIPKLNKVESIRPTICCESCCRKYIVPFDKLYAGMHRLPEPLAAKYFGCTEADFCFLNSCTLYYPKIDRTVRLFLGAEVEILGNRRNQKIWKSERRKRKIEVQSLLGHGLSKLDPILRVFLFGDYFKQGEPLKTTRKDIKRRIRVLDRFRAIRKACKHAHPEAIFNFCIQYPKGTVEDFKSLKTKTKQVFEQFGNRIMRYLTKKERDGLLKTPLKDVVQRFEDRNKRDLILAHLENIVPSDLAREIMKSKACQARMHREDDEAIIAKKLFQFWKEKDDFRSRKEKLESAFREKEMNSDGFSVPQSKYCLGQIDCDPEEIVGIKAVSLQIPNNFQNAERTEIAVARFEECLHYEGLTYDQAVKEAIDFAQNVPLPKICSARGSWDFKFHQSGVWRGTWYSN